MMESLAHILAITQARVIIVDEGCAPKLNALLQSACVDAAVSAEGASPPFAALRLIVTNGPESMISPPPPWTVPSSKTAAATVCSLDTLISPDMRRRHSALIKEASSSNDGDLTIRRRDPEDVFTLLFTSGSTGRPKGAIQTHKMWSQDTFELHLQASPLVSCVYRPLCYATDREVLWRAISNGGRVAVFANDDMTTLFDDLQMIGPSQFSAPPRLWAMLHDRFNKDLARRLADDVARNGPQSSLSGAIRSALLEKYALSVGSRCTSIGVGGASVRPEVFEFMKICFQSSPQVNRVYESYGTTENGGIAINGVIPADVQVMLIDVPDMGFLTSNIPPQGEVCVITKDAIPGYWRDEDNTAKLFYLDDKGFKWIKTGDIGEMMPNGRLKLIDRRGNVVKLANSTFISPEHLEGVFANCPSVQDVFIYAESSWDFPLAVVTLKASSSSNGEAQGDAASPASILTEMRALAAQRDVNPTHVPHGVIVHSERFTVENRLLTISLKTARSNLRAMFQRALRDEYQRVRFGPSAIPPPAVDKLPQQEGAEPPHGDNEDGGMMERKSSTVIFEHQPDDEDTEDLRSIEDGLKKIYCKQLQLQSVSTSESARQLSADSISIAAIREKLQRELLRSEAGGATAPSSRRLPASSGIHIPIDVLWNQPIRAVASLILDQRRALKAGCHAAGGDSFAVSQAGGAALSSATDALVSRMHHDAAFDDRDVLRFDDETASNLRTAPTTRTSRHLLLTGATGFVGAHVLRCLLLSKRTDASASGATGWDKITCLVRGGRAGDAAAVESAAFGRLVEAVQAAMPQTSLDGATALLRNANVSVVASDLSRRCFGLEAATLAELRRHVTHILHVAANVNHVLPHDELAPANVEATRELLRCFAGKGGPLVHFSLVSTISTVGLSQAGSADSESPPLVQLPPSLVAHRALSGYATTKWCAERLLCQASLSLRCVFNNPSAGDGATACIVRLGMTSWCSGTGVGNKNDWITAMASACAALHSFPRAGSGADAARRNIAVIPVDWTAEALLRTLSSGVVVAGARRLGTLPIVHLVPPAAFDMTPMLSQLAHGVALPEVDWVSQLHSLVDDCSTPPPASPDVTKNRRQLRAAAALFPSPQALPGGETAADAMARSPAAQILFGDALLRDDRLTAIPASIGAFVAWCTSTLAPSA